MESRKRKWNKLFIGYIVFSVLFIIPETREIDPFIAFFTSFLLGLNYIVNEFQEASNNLDGIFRIDSEDIKVLIISTCVWLTGACLAYIAPSQLEKSKAFIGPLALAWIIVGGFCYVQQVLYGF